MEQTAMKTIEQSLHLELMRLFPRDRVDRTVPEQINELLAKLNQARNSEPEHSTIADSIKAHLLKFGIKLPKQHTSGSEMLITALSNKQLAYALDHFDLTDPSVISLPDLLELVKLSGFDAEQVYVYTCDEDEEDEEDEEGEDEEGEGDDAEHNLIQHHFQSESDTTTYDFRALTDIPARLRKILMHKGHALLNVRVNTVVDIDYNDTRNIQEIFETLKSFRSDYALKLSRYKKYVELDSEFSGVIHVKGF